MTTEFARILSELSDATRTEDDGGEMHAHSPSHLAGLADCASPDTDDSPGARFLARIAQGVADRVNEDPDVAREDLADPDMAHRIADRAVPDSTYEQWAVFVDLAAWQEDVTELGADASDLTQVAGIALYMIAERLVNALAAELSEALEADEDEGDGYLSPDGTVTDEPVMYPLA